MICLETNGRGSIRKYFNNIAFKIVNSPSFISCFDVFIFILFYKFILRNFWKYFRGSQLCSTI